MPYTPPSSRSPASSTPSSTPTSPDVSRRPSFHHSPNSNSRPALPRSASYLMKHRRTPSASGPVSRHTNQPSPEATSEDLKGMVANTSVRQSPPPVTGDRGMPNGAIISPPDSSSDDDELPHRAEERGRQMEDLKALQAAISQIPQRRSSSPTKNGTVDSNSPVAGDLTIITSQGSAIDEGMHHSLSKSLSTTSLDDLAIVSSRRFSHARSLTEPNISITPSTENSLTGSEEDSDEEMQRKPQMVRKKSGELVRPALRPPSRRRPSSMPGTPTFSKAVHFDSHLEHVRHFLQVDRPLAVSAGSSPVESYESDTEYPFTTDDRPASRTPPFEWEIVMNNFPVEILARKALPVRLERVWLSTDQKCLIGSIAVANLAFQKSVTCRFTLDYWKTTSEVTAEYMTEIRPVETPSRDRFNFTIKLSDLANLESKTLYFCIRYSVNGQEYWDNNGGTNFQADFRKKMLPQNGKKGVIGAASRPVAGLPKSTRRPNPQVAPRPKSVPLGSGDFGDHTKLDFDQSFQEYLGESAPRSIRLKGVKSSTNIPSDNLPSRLTAPSGQAFANRYDFSASLTAAIQNAKDQLSVKPDGLYMKPSKKVAAAMINNMSPPKSVPTIESLAVKAPPAVLNKTVAHVSGTDSPSASISSSSYEELVHKYCFFGSKQSGLPRFDGADDVSKSTNSTNSPSYEGSPVQMVNYQHYHSGTQHHSLHPKDPNPYFHQGSFATIGASPSESPLRSFSPQRMDSPLVGTMRPSNLTQATGRSSPPATTVGNFVHFAGTSSDEYPYQHMHDRFPFTSPDAHSATAIRG
ncbi:putative phosphatase regulatory subunit-domain-containing protein [Lasiosphaeris hirsuta]|uniref:Phosphatase regulatory subunit-domain-containing protein n=1 Tax=Lasiosphaeris hirsuta TaxID=260670 RepID=A0AA40DSS0_9PEZI|nr:putative phosphatase regulatory subunit-domain-containing protein [Lasiosphaeris hirsuta]